MLICASWIVGGREIVRLKRVWKGINPYTCIVRVSYSSTYESDMNQSKPKLPWSRGSRSFGRDREERRRGSLVGGGGGRNAGRRSRIVTRPTSDLSPSVYLTTTATCCNYFGLPAWSQHSNLVSALYAHRNAKRSAFTPQRELQNAPYIRHRQ